MAVPVYRRRVVGRQEREAQTRHGMRRLEERDLLAEPGRLAADADRDDRHPRAARDLEGRAAEGAQPARGRARALGEDDQREALVEAPHRLVEDAAHPRGVVARALEVPRAGEQAVQAAAPVEGRLGDRAAPAEGRGDRADVHERGVVRDHDAGARRQTSQRAAVVEVRDARPARPVVHEAVGAGHEPLQAPRAVERVAARGRRGEREEGVAEGREQRVDAEADGHAPATRASLQLVRRAVGRLGHVVMIAA